MRKNFQLSVSLLLLLIGAVFGSGPSVKIPDVNDRNPNFCEWYETSYTYDPLTGQPVGNGCDWWCKPSCYLQFYNPCMMGGVPITYPSQDYCANYSARQLKNAFRPNGTSCQYTIGNLGPNQVPMRGNGQCINGTCVPLGPNPPCNPDNCQNSYTPPTNPIINMSLVTITYPNDTPGDGNCHCYEYYTVIPYGGCNQVCSSYLNVGVLSGQSNRPLDICGGTCNLYGYNDGVCMCSKNTNCTCVAPRNNNG